MLLLASCAPQVSHHKGLISFTASFANGGYIAIAQSDDSGAHHYVEWDDQGCGQHNGVTSFEVSPDARRINMTLGLDIPGMSGDLTIESREPMDAATAAWARAFSAEIAARR